MYYLATGNSDVVLPERYRLVRRAPMVLWDGAANQPHQTEGELPTTARSYQRLNAFRWAVPEVVTWLLQSGDEPCLLLGSSALSMDGTPWHTLESVWAKADLPRQLGWLLQLARLWDPCMQEGVAASLLDLVNIGVRGWQVRLFYLEHSPATPVLSDLGFTWQALVGAPLLDPLFVRLAEGEIGTAAELASLLEELASRSIAGRIVETTALTHPGKRANNEDALTLDPQGRYAVVCDGMGGHEGGEVASALAIESLESILGTLVIRTLPALQVRQGLARALFDANQRLYDQNRQQGRRSQRQMGTTIVACCLGGPLLHIAHVGDSRIYLITAEGCQQLTVDDDIANLEVSLARATSSTLPTNGGNLTQALGVVSADSLQPTVQTFVLPEDCLILLCSDGLCDYDLIEHNWQEKILPLLYEEMAAGAEALLQWAVAETGHDNTTFVILKHRVEAPASDSGRAPTDLPD
jgi:protein phosphatase